MGYELVGNTHMEHREGDLDEHGEPRESSSVERLALAETLGRELDTYVTTLERDVDALRPERVRTEFVAEFGIDPAEQVAAYAEAASQGFSVLEGHASNGREMIQDPQQAERLLSEAHAALQRMNAVELAELLAARELKARGESSIDGSSVQRVKDLLAVGAELTAAITGSPVFAVVGAVLVAEKAFRSLWKDK